MIDGLPRALTVVAAIGAALNAGVFFTFSTFVMRALGRLAPPQGMAAMQAINREAPTPWFMSVLFGTAALCLGTAGIAVSDWSEPWASYLLTGSVCYLVCIATTVAYHVPRNNALERIDPSSTGAEAAWDRYVPSWTAANHVRTLACFASAVAFVLALGIT
jgi:uncharacterized membrane protein